MPRAGVSQTSFKRFGFSKSPHLFAKFLFLKFVNLGTFPGKGYPPASDSSMLHSPAGSISSGGVCAAESRPGFPAAVPLAR